MTPLAVAAPSNLELAFSVVALGAGALVLLAALADSVRNLLGGVKFRGSEPTLGVEAVASALGFDASSSGRWVGAVGGRRVTLEHVRGTDFVGGRSGPRTLVRVELPHACRGLTIGADAALAQLERREGEQAVETGDDAFDRHMGAKGEQFRTLALLSAPVRTRLAEVLVPGRALVRDGTVSWMGPSKFATVEELTRVIDDLVEVAARLDVSDLQLPERLADAYRTDLPAVRRKAFDALVHSAPDDPATLDVLAEALADPDPEVRLYAAERGGSRGFGVLVSLVGEPVDEQLRIRALEALWRLHPRERVLPLVDELIEHEVDALLPTLVTLLAEVKDFPRLHDLSRHAAKLGFDAARRLVLAVQAEPGPLLEETLLRCLSRGFDVVAPVALEALRSHGTLAAVEPILVATAGTLEAARGRRVVEAIQAREAVGVRGGLSMVEPVLTDGALSLAPGAGELSLATDESLPTPTPSRVRG